MMEYDERLKSEMARIVDDLDRRIRSYQCRKRIFGARQNETVLTNGAPGQWGTTRQAIDGNFGPDAQALVKAFQTWAGVTADGVIDDATWSVSLRAAGATLDSQVGLKLGSSQNLPKSIR
jgi:murein L,D-transpeptidase YcbB/YkuD